MQTDRSPLTQFNGGDTGEWQVVSQRTIIGAAIPSFLALAIGPAATPPIWSATGFTSNLRYTSALERRDLLAASPGAGRGDRCAVLIPMSKSPAWWELAQDQRQRIFDQGRHMRIGMTALPAVARRLYHSRDLGEAFDFLTWFEFAPAAEPLFDTMLAELRACPEWHFVDREVEVRLRR